MTSRNKSVIIGINDDAAVLDEGSEHLILVTTDAFVEKIHFDCVYASFYQIGWKAMAANLSDIAAMGGIPSVATSALAVSNVVSVEDIQALYQGMDAIGERFYCDIVGGDTISSSGPMMLSITLLGKVSKKQLTLRSGAQVGDLICVTGHLGGSRAGLKVLQKHSQEPSSVLHSEDETLVIKKHLEPMPRIMEASLLTRTGAIHAMIDVSDGLSSEIHHICTQSQVGAKIFAGQVPIDSSTKRIAEAYQDSALDYALSGGEDFELLFTVSPEDIDRCSLDTHISVIGEILEQEADVTLHYKDGSVEHIPCSGYQHFGKYDAIKM